MTYIQKYRVPRCCSLFLHCLHFKVRTLVLLRRANTGSGDKSTGSRGKLCDQAGAGCGEAAVQHSQREPRESPGHHQRAATAEGK